MSEEIKTYEEMDVIDTESVDSPTEAQDEEIEEAAEEAVEDAPSWEDLIMERFNALEERYVRMEEVIGELLADKAKREEKLKGFFAPAEKDIKDEEGISLDSLYTVKRKGR